MPTNEYLRPYVQQILELMFALLELENEENVLVCLRVIIELHKQYRPVMQPEVRDNSNSKLLTSDNVSTNQVSLPYNNLYGFYPI